MEWQDYISLLLSSRSSFDEISLSFDDSDKRHKIPPLIKASILMLDKMRTHQGRFNILVFPERIQSIFIFTLVELLYSISEGRIDRNYNPDAFEPGENLRFGSAVVEFVGTEKRDGQKCMILQLADLKTSAPIEYFPLFQKTHAQKLSKYKVFSEARKKAQAQLFGMSPDEKHLKLLADYKTHMDSSIVNMTSILNTKELISDCRLCNQRVKDIILVGQADFEGSVKNIGAGQLAGTPAIVLASDLYAISAMAEQGHPIQSIIIDGSNANALLTQMDALDTLMRLDFSVTCVTDVVNSFDLQPFLERGFNLWRWDESSITSGLYAVMPLPSDRKTRNCANRKVDYLTADSNEINTAIRLLYAHRKESQTSSAQMSKISDELYAQAFTVLREIAPFEEDQRTQVRMALDKCSTALEREKPFLSEKNYDDYDTIISCLKKVYTQEFTIPKHDALAERLSEQRLRMVALVVPDRCDKDRIRTYWLHWCRRKGMATEIHAFYPAEYYLLPCDQYDTTIVVGWLKRAIMRKILYSFNTPSYIVLLYDCEKRWKNYDTSKWNAALDSAQNEKTIERSFAADKLQISSSRFVPAAAESDEIPGTDEFAEIELILRENKYRHYAISEVQTAGGETAEAVPVSYVGGHFAFYRTGHKVISASDIIENDGDKIESKLPNELKMGDFIVVREADRDLVREIADVLLQRAGKMELRGIASKWKEALEIETLFNSPEKIYERLQEVGCTRGYQAVRSWITDEDMISPHSKQDLEHIAAITGSGVLTEMLDQVYDAAQAVKTAHVQAGRVLSLQLRNSVVAALKEYGDIDPFNIWEPIEMQMDGVGLVRILKIIDIGAPVIVNVADTNRLIDEE